MWNNILLITPHFLTVLGFLLAILLLVHLLRSDQSPAATFAWLLAILLVPYVGVPLYILYGGRKMKKMASRKNRLTYTEAVAEKITEEDEVRFHYPSLFPVHKGNQLQFLETGEEAYKEIVELIKNSKNNIYITAYILGKDKTAKKILELLSQKAKDGVEVCLLLDALGCFYIKKGYLKHFTDAGGHVAYFMPMFPWPFWGRANLRNHRKMILVDHKAAIIGGMNIAKEYIGEVPDKARWVDLSFLARGPVVIDFYNVFQSDWNFAAEQPVLKEACLEEMEKHSQDVLLQAIPSGPDVEGDALLETILAAIFRAEKRIWILTPYFIPNEILLKALCIAAKNGIDVRIIVPNKSNHPVADLVRRGYLRTLQASKAKILRYTKKMLHAKLILIDDDLAITGSANMDIRSLSLNYEIALFIYAEKEIVEISDWVEELQKGCEENLKPSTPVREVLEGVVRLFAPLL